MALTDSPIMCPLCGGDCLHHEQIEIFNRNQEDSVTGLRIVVLDCTYTTAMNADERNPSQRRNGVRIVFWCEGCDRHPALTLIQHKGQTFIEWE